jgi:hypothetical protein
MIFFVTMGGTVVGNTYRVEPPDGSPFYAKIIRGSDTAPLAVVSNRDGKWAPEMLVTVADLLMPEQEFIEWDVREFDPDGGAGSSTADVCSRRTPLDVGWVGQRPTAQRLVMSCSRRLGKRSLRQGRDAGCGRCSPRWRRRGARGLRKSAYHMESGR